MMRQPPLDADTLTRAVVMLSDLIIALAYYAIPAGMLLVMKAHPHLPFRWLLWLFVAFIVACGTTHLMGVVDGFVAMPRLSALVEMVTAIVSALTALTLLVFRAEVEKGLRGSEPKGGGDDS